MDFAEFEQIALQVLFETRSPITVPQLAYQARVTSRKAERFLARMVEDGTVLPRLGPGGYVEYVLPGRLPEPAASGARSEAPADEEFDTATAVRLSMLLPGAGHIYAGRSGLGFAWMGATLAGYACFVVPGLLLHRLCLASAARTRPAPSP